MHTTEILSRSTVGTPHLLEVFPDLAVNSDVSFASLALAIPTHTVHQQIDAALALSSRVTFAGMLSVNLVDSKLSPARSAPAQSCPLKQSE